MKTIFIKSMKGIGDQIYSRPLVKKLHDDPDLDVYISTALPELYQDLKRLKIVKPTGNLYRTQEANFLRSTKILHDEPQFPDKIIKPYYGRAELKRYGIYRHIESAFGFNPSLTVDLDLPDWKDASKKVDELLAMIPARTPIAVVRPPTVRSEWSCETRNPDPNYINWCTRILTDVGYCVISVADCSDGSEWIVGDEPPATIKLHRGELNIWETLTLLKRVKMVISGSGFMVPATIAAKTNLFIIFGGRGEYDNARTILDPRMDLRKIGWAVPDNFCRCNKMVHDCDKTISDLDFQFMRFLRDIQ